MRPLIPSFSNSAHHPCLTGRIIFLTQGGWSFVFAFFLISCALFFLALFSFPFPFYVFPCFYLFRFSLDYLVGTNHVVTNADALQRVFCEGEVGRYGLKRTGKAKQKRAEGERGYRGKVRFRAHHLCSFLEHVHGFHSETRPWLPTSSFLLSSSLFP